jgi:hypothetical protein
MESLYSIGGLSTHPPDKSGRHRTSTIGGTVKKVQRQYVVESQLAVNYEPFSSVPTEELPSDKSGGLPRLLS